MAITTEQIKELARSHRRWHPGLPQSPGTGRRRFRQSGGFPARERPGNGRQARRPRRLRRDGRAVLARQWAGWRDGRSELRDRFCRSLGSLPHLCPRNCPADRRQLPRTTSRPKISRPKCWSTSARSPAPGPAKKAKPEAVLEKIVEGRIEKFKDEVCLLRQPYIRDETHHHRKAAAAEYRCHRREHRHPALRPLGTG